MHIRPVSEHDLEDIIRIDEQISGKRRVNHWESRITYVIRRDPDGSLVAENDGRVVGFIIADVRGEEFGFSQTTGWVEVLAVHPDYQRKEVAKSLVEHVMKRFRTVGVSDVRTLVGDKQPTLEQRNNAMDSRQGHVRGYLRAELDERFMTESIFL